MICGLRWLGKAWLDEDRKAQSGANPLIYMVKWRKKAKKNRMRKQAEFFNFNEMAEWTGLEPATPGVTGRYSNQLNYHSW